VNKDESVCFLSWIIVGFILGIGWVAGELLKGGGFGPAIGSTS
jgi:hypothetical protein